MAAPLVTVSGHLPWVDCPSVYSDNRKGIFLMVNYLASLKHERIGFLGGVRGIEPTMTRLQTFREALAEHGLDVPGDISIAGIDNIPFSQYVHPPITTVDLRGPEQGRIAVEMLVDILHGTDGETERVLEPRLAVRGSCASP